MNTKDSIRKLIELSSIKREYLFDMQGFIKKEISLMRSGSEELTSEIVKEKFKIQDMIFRLDIEFVNTLDDIKLNEGIASIIELDKMIYPSLYELKMVIDEVCSFEVNIENLQGKLKEMKLKKIGKGKTLKTTATLNAANMAYKKNRI